MSPRRFAAWMWTVAFWMLLGSTLTSAWLGIWTPSWQWAATALLSGIVTFGALAVAILCWVRTDAPEVSR